MRRAYGSPYLPWNLLTLSTVLLRTLQAQSTDKWVLGLSNIHSIIPRSKIGTQ